MNSASRQAQILTILGEGLATAEVLANRIGASVRTVFRDIAALRAGGEDIRGGAGVGFLLRERKTTVREPGEPNVTDAARYPG